MIDLSNDEIKMIAQAIEVAQFECQIPEATESEEIKILLDKLGISYDSGGHVILDE